MTATASSAPARSTGRQVWMDQLRGLAIVLVVAFHAKTVLARFVPDIPAALDDALDVFAPFRMPLLMFLSGMLLARSLAKPLRPYAVGKLRRIAWPYAVWSLVFLVVAARATPGRLLALPVDPPDYLWYLHNLLLYYAAVRGLRALRVPVVLQIPVSLAAAVVVDGYGVRRFFFLFVFFAGGQLYAEHRDRLRVEDRGVWLVLSGTVAAISAIVSAAGIDLKYEPEFVLVPALGIVLCLLLAPRHGHGPVGAALAFVGRDSIVFYVAHYPAQWALYWWLREAGVQQVLPMYAAGVAVALAVGVALALLRRRHALADALFELPPVRTRSDRLG